MKPLKYISLQRKILFSVVLASIIFISLFIGINFYFEYVNQVRQLDEKIHQLITAIKPSLVKAVWDFDPISMNTQAESIVRLDDVVGITILDEEDQVLVEKYKGNIKPESKDNIMTYAFPLIFKFQQEKDSNIGNVIVYVTKENVINNILKSLMTLVLSQFLNTFILCFIILWIIHQLMTKPLEAFTFAIQKIAQGSHDIQLETDRNDEIGQLANHFSLMAKAVYEREASLKQSESRFRRVSESNMLGIIFADLDGRITQANDYFVQLSGYSHVEIESGNVFWTKITPPEYVDADQKAIMQLDEMGVFYPFEKEYIKKNGQRFYVLLGGALLEGSKTEVVAFVLDITDRKKAELERDHHLKQEQEARLVAERALQERDNFITLASHELRTPLTPLKMQIDLAERLLKKDSVMLGPNYTYLMKIVQTFEKPIHRLIDLAEDMLNASQMRSGQITLSKEMINLPDLVRKTVTQILSEQNKEKYPLEIQAPNELIGNWDKSRIELVVSKLTKNAIRFGLGKPILITVSQEGSSVKLIIQDHGIGISDEGQKRIFHRFERDVSPQHFGGLGLGLYITKMIVDAHQGRIAVDSTLGFGTTFTVTLPIAPLIKVC